VKLPAEPTFSARTPDFLRVAGAQGIEVVRQVEPDGSFIVRCEPRIWHWCGNDPVKAHFEQFVLNELVIAFGYATYDETSGGLTDHERLRLQIAENIARERQYGLWERRPYSADHSFEPALGLKISKTHGLALMIQVEAGEGYGDR
jgi:hypothetical protein